jgi:hypothetical protein
MQWRGLERQKPVCVYHFFRKSPTFDSRMANHHIVSPRLVSSSQSKTQSKLITYQTTTFTSCTSQHLLLHNLLNLLRHPPKQRLALPLRAIRLRIRHNPPLSLTNPRNPPRPLIPRLLKELQILIEAPAARLRHVHVRPDARKQVGSGEYGEEFVGEVVEEDGC